MSRVKRDYEYIVLGLGGLGSAAAYWLARRAGAEVLGLEQFELGHVRGESQDHSRIIRLSYHTPAYVELAKHAYRAWAELEQDAGEQLVLKTGGLDFAPRESAIPLSNYSDSMDAAGVPYEHLDAAEISAALAAVRARPTTSTGCSSRTAASRWRRGATRRTCAWRARTARRCVDARRSSGIRPGTARSRSTAGGATYRCRRLVIAAGAWSNRALAHFGMRLPLRVTKEQVTYFASPHAADFAAGPVPDLDLDGRSLLLRLPGLRRGGAQGGAGRGRQRRSPPTRGPSSRTRRRSSV